MRLAALWFVSVLSPTASFHHLRYGLSNQRTTVSYSNIYLQSASILRQWRQWKFRSKLKLSPRVFFYFSASETSLLLFLRNVQGINGLECLPKETVNVE